MATDGHGGGQAEADKGRDGLGEGYTSSKDFVVQFFSSGFVFLFSLDRGGVPRAPWLVKCQL